MIYSSKSSPFPEDLTPNWTADDCRRLDARTVSEVRDHTQLFAADLLAAGFARPESYGLRVAFEEALLNGIKHGNGNVDAAASKSACSIELQPTRCW